MRRPHNADTPLPLSILSPPSSNHPACFRIKHNRCAPVAQLDRASAFEAEGREFESLRARHFPTKNDIFGPSAELSTFSIYLASHLFPHRLFHLFFLPSFFP